MSLINDVLRELADQQDTSGALVSERHPMLPQAPFFDSKYVSWVPIIALFIAVFLAVLVLQHQLRKNNTPISEESTIVASNDAGLAKIIEPKLQESVAPNGISSTEYSNNELIKSSGINKHEGKVERELTTEPAINNTETLLQIHIDELLSQAERAISMGRLTAPIEDNAYAYYQKILSVRHDYAAAKEGLNKLAHIYLVKAAQQERLGNSSLAQTYTQRAKVVSPQYVNEFDSNSINAMAAALPVNKNAAIDEDIIPNTNALQVQANVSEDTKRTTSVKSFDVAEAMSTGPVVTNAGWHDEDAAQQAKELLAAGKVGDAQTLLKNIISTQTKSVQSTIALIDIYLQQDNVEAAKLLIAHADYVPSIEKTRIQAQMLGMEGKDTEAITLLEQHLSEASSHEKYRALLASFYHKTANYQQSMLSYQRLISTAGDKPAYWLGLALAFDGLSQHKSALQTYKHLKEFPQLQAQVSAYVDQRIAVLQNE